MEDIKLEPMFEDGLAKCDHEAEIIKTEPVFEDGLDDIDFTVVKSEPILLTGDAAVCEPRIGDTSNPKSSNGNETIQLHTSRIFPEKQTSRVEIPLNNKGINKPYACFEEEKNFEGALTQHGEPCLKKSPLPSDKSSGISVPKPKKNTTSAAYEVYVCECGYNAPNRSVLSRHQSSHTEQQYRAKQIHSCGYCGFVFGRRHSLAAHVRSVHSVYIEAKKYACDFCVFSTNNRPMFLRHMNIHYGVHFPCGSCDCGFNSRILLDHHIRLVHSGICNICGYATPEGESLKSHLLQGHSREKLYDCDHCDFIGGAIEVLRVHMVANHFSILQKSNPPSPTTVSATPVLACGECGYKTDKDAAFKAHTKMYHGTNCVICGYTVEFGCYMITHVKTHSYKLQNLVHQNLAEEFSRPLDPKGTGLKRISGSEESPKPPKNKNNIVHTCDNYDDDANNRDALETQTKIHTDGKQHNYSWTIRKNICSAPVIDLVENEMPVEKYDPLTCGNSGKTEQMGPIKTRTEHAIEDCLELPTVDTNIPEKRKPQHEDPSKKELPPIKPFEVTQMYKCGGCDFNAYDKFTMKAHLEIHKESLRHFRGCTAYTCCMCGDRFHSASSLIAHKLVAHEKLDLPSGKKVTRIKRSDLTLTYKRGGCDFNTLSKSTMPTHMQIHKERQRFIRECETYAHGQSESFLIAHKFENHNALPVLDHPSKPRTLKRRESEPEIPKILATHSLNFSTDPKPALKVISDHKENLLKVSKTENNSPKVQVLSIADVPARPDIILDKRDDPLKKQVPRRIYVVGTPEIEEPETDCNFVSVDNYFDPPEIEVNQGIFDEEDDGTYACDDCNYITELQTDFVEHLRSHMEQEIKIEDPLAFPT